MKKLILFLATLCSVFILTACSSELKVTGCRIIRQEDDFVTYQVVCDQCGYEYGDPVTMRIPYSKQVFSVNCSRCHEIIYVSLERD